MKKLYLLILFALAIFIPAKLVAQGNPRLIILQQKLDSLARFIPGLNKPVQLSISGVPIQEYLRAISRSNNINFYVDPTVNVSINNTFPNVVASNIILLMAQQYNLDIDVTGSILVIKPHFEPAVKPKIKELNVQYQKLNNVLSVDVANDSLAAVARKITQVSGKNIIVPPALQGKVVTAFITAADFDVAMDKFAYANEIKMVKTNDSFYLFQTLDENEQLYVNGDKNTSVKRVFKPINNTPAANVGIYVQTVGGQKLVSVNAANSSIMDLVRSASQEMNKNYFIYSEIKGNINFINANNLTYESFLDLIFKGTDYTYNQENNVYLIGERKLEGLRANLAVMLQNRSIDTVLAMIPQDWKRGIEIKEFREQNTLLLSGSKPQIQEIAALIKQIDVLVPQILIEVTLIDVHKTRKISTGLSAGTADSVKTGGTILPGVNFTLSSRSVNDLLNRLGGVFSTNLGRVTPNFYLNIKALEAQNNVDVRSVPKLAALNGHTASLSIGNTVFYKNVTQNVFPSAATNTSIFTNEYRESNANLTINIRPIVSGDDQVTLGIKIDISDFTSIPTDGSPPPKSTSKFESTLRAHNEDMIVLGGIERTESSDNSSGIPLLSRIPILKWIFSSKEKVRSKVVTLVFIKPTIIR
ncbi:secretin and TonB N-terminal domain-containing protein [Mucilaginibacter sp. ZT4R22]|uniref:Secretin and TonB N-terminal domain-containing protein n=1 Tax=Mucilaginibacter pankratovii TaxID=2772110 RepID=A0ABR7WNE4_9SPHI|nr:secretin and TonB N-terminal domain-containing protein [Mucilaginibacter pankratovii]MBD1363822.1 secretin and TonB N-terminal domain-containing protein [Mucilaginibacter pankratovii]